MTNHPLDTLLGYRLGSRQATVELQSADASSIHIDFAVLKLVNDICQRPGQAIILTGTAGDGKTYLAYRIIDALGLDKKQVMAAQRSGGYLSNGVFIDLDLSAGMLTSERVQRVHRALAQPQRLSLVCANEGKLAELEDQLQIKKLILPNHLLRINLSQRALVSSAAWEKVLLGVLLGDLWQGFYPSNGSCLAWNRNWLQDTGVAERLRCYLLLPYLLGEPITVREALSFLAYALGGGLNAVTGDELPEPERIRYLLFNTIFSEPENYRHGGRSVPIEKLLWWLYRFDPADKASPEVDLDLLVKLDRLEVAPPAELLAIWQHDLVVQEKEESDSEYRQRLSRFMRYARRWYALSSERGFQAYFPFQHFQLFLRALSSPEEHLQENIPALLKGLNLLLSGGVVEEDLDLKLYFLPVEGGHSGQTVYSTTLSVDESDLQLSPDNITINDEAALYEIYLEKLPRRLYLLHKEHTDTRLPISLMLYEVLMGASSPQGGFPATLWAKERDTVARFVANLGHVAGEVEHNIKLTIALEDHKQLNLNHNISHMKLTVN